MSSHPRVAVVGGGIGGLTLALELHAAGIECQVFEAVPELSSVGVGINLLPHATRQLARARPGRGARRGRRDHPGVVFYNRFGQLIYTEPSGSAAGYPWPQFSIHRGDLQRGAARRGARAARRRRRCGRPSRTRVDAGRRRRDRPVSREPDGTTSTERADVVVACDGIHSAVRGAAAPGRGRAALLRLHHVARGRRVAADPDRRQHDPAPAGWPPASSWSTRSATTSTAQGRQLVNWVAELETPQRGRPRLDTARAASRTSSTAFADWHFDWLDVPALIAGIRHGPANTRWWTRSRCDRWSHRPGDAARRRRAPDGAARLERRRAGHPRRSRARRRAGRTTAIRSRRSRAYERPPRRPTATAVLTPTARTRRTRSCARSTSGPATGRSTASRTSSPSRSWTRSSRATSAPPATRWRRYGRDERCTTTTTTRTPTCAS